MDNSSNNFTNSILQSSESSLNLEDSSSSLFDSLKSINLTTWLLIFVILAFLGFNIFVYLAKGTQDFTNFFKPVFEKIFGVAIATTSQVVDVSSEGAKGVISETANVVNNGLSDVQNLTPGGLNTSSQQKSHDYQANDSPSFINSGKSGWCYIGEDRGFRSCAEVGPNDQCMSGDIFPTNDICINPNLRP